MKARHTIHAVPIRKCHGRHFKFYGAFNERFRLRCAIKKTECAGGVEFDVLTVDFSGSGGERFNARTQCIIRMADRRARRVIVRNGEASHRMAPAALRFWLDRTPANTQPMRHHCDWPEHPTLRCPTGLPTTSSRCFSM